MNKTASLQLKRKFLIERLPEPLEPKSAHIQIFDNYLEGTRLRLRLVRDPQSKDWTRILQQQIFNEENLSESKLAEIFLSESEYSNFEQFEGREIRKNRYFHEFDNCNVAFDVYLGDLWGLHIASVEFENEKDLQRFEPLSFAIFEITTDAFFLGKNLVGKRLDDVQVRVAQIGESTPPFMTTIED